MIPIAKPLIGEEEIDNVVKVLKSGMIAQGPRVAEFEEKFAEYVGVDHAVAASSGTTALHLAILAAGIGKGDEVITTPFSFVATGNCILYAGACPVFVDIDPLTYNINPSKIEEAVTDKTRALLPVHLYGQPAQMDEINRVARDNDLVVIEDAAQAHGALYNNEKTGSLGDMGCFSFYPTKNMTTSEGGIITTDNEEIADNARILRAHGEKERYSHVVLGYNFRMTDIAAAIGLSQLKKLDGFNQRRQENAEYLTEHIKEIPGIQHPHVLAGAEHMFHQYTIRVGGGKREEFMKFLNENGVGTGIHYPITLYQQKLYRDLNFDADCPESEKAANEVLSLPVHPNLSVEDVEKIVNVISTAANELF